VIIEHRCADSAAGKLQGLHPQAHCKVDVRSDMAGRRELMGALSGYDVGAQNLVDVQRQRCCAKQEYQRGEHGHPALQGSTESFVAESHAFDDVRQPGLMSSALM